MTARLPFSLLLPAAIVAGAFNVFAFAPFGLWPLQIVLLALLFSAALDSESIKRASLLGLAYGWGWMTCGVHWLYISMHRYGGMPSWMAALAVALLALGMGAYFALATGVTVWLKRRWQASPAIVLLLILPSVWTLSEWLRGWVFTGFPWIVSGYAHSTGPLAGYAPLIGVYGIGWLAALLASLLVLLPSKKMSAAAIIAILFAGWGLQHIAWTTPHGKPVSVRLLQGNVPQELKFDPDHLKRTLSEYDLMIRLAPANLIATPEVALPLLSSELPEDFLQRLKDYSKQTGSRIALGIPVSDGPQVYANSMLGIAPDSAPLYRYDKHHLVPFGEFIPPGFRWFVDMMSIPLGDMTRGAILQAPFAVQDQWVMPNICYEDLFGEEIADQIAAGYFGSRPQPSIMLNMSNIAWFGDSIALPQHLQISQMRALEMRRPVLRATNTGATAVIDRDGTLLGLLQPFKQGVLIANVQGYEGVTPYIVLGNRLIVTLALFLLAAAWHLCRRGSYSRH